MGSRVEDMAMDSRQKETAKAGWLGLTLAVSLVQRG